MMQFYTKKVIVLFCSIFLLTVSMVYGQEDFALRINTGGGETTYEGEAFFTDNYFDTGLTLDRPQTGLPEPYQSFRFSRSQQMGYAIPLEDGEYTVNLYFAELWFGATGGGSGGVGSRVFDVNIEGQLAEDNLDIFDEVGADTMLMKSHTVTVTGGVLDIDFDSRDAVGGERHPVINAIEILGEAPLEDFAVTEIVVVDWNDNSKLFSLEDGSRYPYYIYGGTDTFSIYFDPNNFKANTSGDVGSVKFTVTGSTEFESQVGNESFTLFTQNQYDEAVDFIVPEFYNYFYTITATPYSEEDFGGVAGESLTVSFEIYSTCYESLTNSFDINTHPACDINGGSVELTTVGEVIIVYSGEGYQFEAPVDEGNGPIYRAHNLSAGTYSVGIFDNDGNSDCYANYEFIIEEVSDCPVPIDFALQINTGGTEATYNDKVFAADTYFDTGRTLDRPQTGLPEPYQTFRYSRSQQMSYDIPLEDGEYTVNLYFAELWFGATGGGAGGVGSRVFDVSIEGQLAEDNLDIFDEVGADAMLVKTHTVTVTGGVLNIDFDSRDLVGGERHPVINAIEILGEVFETEQRPFITTWEASTITIGVAVGDYNFTVDWGDGTTSENVTGEITHTYDTSESHTVSITGDFPRFSSSSNGTIKEIKQWGDIQWKSFVESFSFDGRFSAIDISATDVPNLRQVTSLSSMFSNNGVTNSSGSVSQWDVSSVRDMSKMFFRSNINLELGNWDVSNVIDMSNMFEGTLFDSETGIGSWDVGSVRNMDYMFFYLDTDGNFNEDISNWDVSSVESMIGMLYGSGFNHNIGDWDVSNVTSMLDMLTTAGLSNENYDKTLIGWSQLSVLQNEVQLDAPQNQYCDAEEARQHLIDTYGWTINDEGLTEDCIDPTLFITTWKTDNPGLSNDNQITIPTVSGELYNYDVDWGDGTSDSGVTGNIVHTYATPGMYQVSITGTFPRIDFHNIGDGVNEREKILSIDQWGDIVWSSMEDAFVACKNLDVLATDVPNFSSMSSTRAMFGGCSSLKGNESMNGWNVSTITDMRGMFSSTMVFNQNIGSWDVSNVRDMTGMFNGASIFNQNIGDWNVGNVQSMWVMFGAAHNFNQDISRWNVGNVTNMGTMFSSAHQFNQPIGSWDVSNVTNMSWMFSGATAFNNDLSSWNVSKVEDMKYMFQSTIFNKDIGNWNVGQVMDMTNMFRLNTSFNQEIGSWDVSNVELMNSMFYGVPTFDQDLSNWNVGNVTNMRAMFFDAGLSIANYDSTLQGWNSLPSLQTGVVFTAGFSEYCLGAEARQNLIDQFGWIILDEGENCTSVPDGIWLEAECAIVGDNWSVINSEIASGGQYLLPPSGFNSSPVNNSESIVLFEAQIAEPGTYTIHVLLNAPSGSEDSFWVRVNSGSWYRWNNIPKNADFKWNRVHDRENFRIPLSFDLSAGLNTIEFGHREEGIGLDKIHITNTASLPTGFGETDESCSSGLSGKRAIADTNSASLTPNPVVNTTALSFEKPVKLTTIQIFDVMGRLVHTYNGPEVTDQGSYVLQVNDLESGTYFINSVDVKGIKHQKQMVIKK